MYDAFADATKAMTCPEQLRLPMSTLARSHDSITKIDNLASSDTLARQQRTMGPRQLPGQTLSTGNGESRTMAYVKSLIRP